MTTPAQVEITRDREHADGAATVVAAMDSAEILRDVVRLDSADARREFVAALIEKAPALAAHRDDLLAKVEGLAARRARTTSPDETDQDDGPTLRQWPAPIEAAAHRGVVGDFVAQVSPYTEADPAALLVQFVVAAGNAIGRGPYLEVGADHHGANLFAVLVGPTASGRKGTSWGCVRKVFDIADEVWIKERIGNGLASGEGLIWALRDPVFTRQPVREGKEIVDYEEVESDPGVTDKRLLVVEPEFARVLTVMKRDGNTLSALMREAWDRAHALRSMTKGAPLKATEPHVSIVAHVTLSELSRRLEDVDVANGVANRFLWIASRRSKLLPLSPAVPAEVVEKIGRELRHRLCEARRRTRMDLSTEAREVWCKVYPQLTDDARPGRMGAVLSRAAPIVLRLALIYALLEGAREIEADHVRAGLAIWRYAEDSAEFAFGLRLANPRAERIAKALRAAGERGLSRSELSALFGRNLPAKQLNDALADVPGVEMEKQPSRSGGRPALRYRLRRNAETSEPTNTTAPATGSCVNLVSFVPSLGTPAGDGEQVDSTGADL